MDPTLERSWLQLRSFHSVFDLNLLLLREDCHIIVPSKIPRVVDGIMLILPPLIDVEKYLLFLLLLWGSLGARLDAH